MIGRIYIYINKFIPLAVSASFIFFWSSGRR
jgi:hypothetical protein